MANVPSIPPLLCSTPPPLVCCTPPPIDFGEDDDDFGFTEDDEFNLATDPNEYSENSDDSPFPLTTDDHGGGFLTSSSPPPLQDAKTLEARTEVKPVETFNFNISVGLKEETNSENYMDLRATDVATDSVDVVISNTKELSENPDNSTANTPSLNLDTLSLDSDSLNVEVENLENLEDSSIKSTTGNCIENEIPFSSCEPAVDGGSIMVTIEDITDASSDEECHSPKKQNLILDENSADYFAIHRVTGENKNDNVADKEYDNSEKDTIVKESDLQAAIDTVTNKDESVDNTVSDLDDFTCISPSLVTKEMTPEKYLMADIPFDADFSQFSEAVYDKTETPSSVPMDNIRNIPPEDFDVEDDDDDDDFDDFQDFSAAMAGAEPNHKQVLQVEEPTTTEVSNNLVNANRTESEDTLALSADKEQAVVNSTVHIPPVDSVAHDDDADDDDDDFDDFQDFSAAVATVTEISPHQVSDSTTITSTNLASDNEDDFGDFAEATFTRADQTTMPSATEVSNNLNSQFSIANAYNLDKHLQPVLNIMFPTAALNDHNDEPSTDPHISDVLQLSSIDTTKALEYQWINSSMRHALIKSLGIDSQNILFGEKWNLSVPRFAANLSFNPLKPLKPQQSSTSACASLDEQQPTHSTTQQMSNDAKALKSDVPVVKFDWNSSGLVNPLDGLKEAAHTGETEAIHTTQPGESHAADDEGQPQSHSADGHNGSDDSAISAGFDAPTALPTVATAAAATALPTVVPTVSIGYSFNNNGHDFDLDHKTVNAVVSRNSKTTPEKDESYVSSSSISNNNTGMPLQLTNDDDDDDDDDEVMTTSTYAGPLKETHIYTPSKSENAIMAKTMRATPKAVPIDFDYEIAAAGIIIDETVVKKEYRDVEYNPGFGLEFSRSNKTEFIEDTAKTDKHSIGLTEAKTTTKPNQEAHLTEYEDEFSDFQSVSLPSTTHKSNVSGIALPPPIDSDSVRESAATMRTPIVTDQMILSPAILLPQAITIDSNKPKIEWGESAASINPEELARIEELFPQAKAKTKELSGGSHRSTPTHNAHSLSISATIARQEQDSANDDDDWSEYVSVPAVMAPKIAHTNSPKMLQLQNRNNNHNHHHSPSSMSPQRKNQSNVPSPRRPNVETSSNSNSNDDEWSDFVSSAPAAAVPQFRAAMPQFNSAAWQNANFYNNPLSFYHQSHTQVVPHAAVPKFQHNNNNNNYHNSNINQYLSNYQQQQQQRQLQPQAPPQPQQIHIMQDFSTAPTSTPTYHTNEMPIRTSAAAASQFQVGSAKVAPSISLIPDLGFAAPALATRTTFINSLPKPSLTPKK